MEKPASKREEGSRPDPGTVTLHPQGPGALGRPDPGAPGRGGKGRSGVNPHTHAVRNPVPASLQHPEVLLVIRRLRSVESGVFLSQWQTVTEIVAEFVANEGCLL